MAGELPVRLPIFPLPKTVFFPDTILPLHVFEPRYRQMVADHLPGGRVLGIVLLQSGWQEDTYGSPPVYSVGCAGTMDDVVKLADGRYMLKLTGRWKIEILRTVEREPYRTAEVRELPEDLPDESLVAVQESRTRLMGAYTALAAAREGRPSNPFTFDSSLSYGTIVNLACMHLGIEPEQKQRLLELHDVEERGRRIIRMLEEEHQRVLTLQRLEGGEGGPVH